MKIFKIERCKSPDCPFFKQIVVNVESCKLGLCDREKRYIMELDQSGDKDGSVFESEMIFVDGKFPDWCPLEDFNGVDKYEL